MERPSPDRLVSDSILRRLEASLVDAHRAVNWKSSSLLPPCVHLRNNSLAEVEHLFPQVDVWSLAVPCMRATCVREDACWLVDSVR